MKTVRLNNGVEMPMEGFGVFQIPEDSCEQVVKDAIDLGSLCRRTERNVPGAGTGENRKEIW